MTASDLKLRAPLYGVLLAGVALRGVLFASSAVHTTLQTRPELVTAVSAFQRVKEAAFLFESTGSPYTGDVFHQPPLVFALFYPLFTLPESVQYVSACCAFILVDVLVALGLARLCQRTHELEEARVPTHDGHEIWLNKVPVSPLFATKYLPATVAMVYLFNPYSLASTIAMATSSLTHLAVVYAMVFASEGAVAACSLCLTTASYLSVYPIILAVPLTLVISSNHASKVSSTALRLAVLSIFWTVMLLTLSKMLSGDWHFLEETYVWVAKYSDLTPNVGIFWYFFIEVFDRFIPYFLLVLHLHPLIYVVPIAFRLSTRPQVYATALFGIASLFQAYPSFGDFGLFLALMSIHPKTIAMINSRYVYAMGLAVATCMMPVMWFLWLFPASGNANFFYNQTLVYQIFNCQLINAFVGATMKRDKNLQLFRKRLVSNSNRADGKTKAE